MRASRPAGPGWALILGLALAGPALAQPADVPPADLVQERLEALLRGYHQTPDRATLLALDPQVHKRLQALAGEAAGVSPWRFAALEALAGFPDARTRALYQAAVAPGQPPGLRHRVLRLWPRAFGLEALPVLEAALQDPDGALRLTAAYAVDDLPGAAAEKLLAAAVARETAPAIRAGMQALVARRAQLR